MIYININYICCPCGELSFLLNDIKTRIQILIISILPYYYTLTILEDCQFLIR